MKYKVLLGAAVTVAVLALVLLRGTPSPPPTILVAPYLQPGDGRGLNGSDVKAILWLTDQQPGEFVVEVSSPGRLTRMIRPTRIALDFPGVRPFGHPVGEEKKKPSEQDQHYFRYTAHLDNLPFNADISYRVKLDDEVIREATFRSRATADKSVRCVLVGDMADGRKAQKSVAYQIGLLKPEFLVALGDIVYPTGCVHQYMTHFWTTYNDVPIAGPKEGAPLMATVPFYAVLGNHDIAARLGSAPDALAAYYFFLPPKGGPGEGPWATPLSKDAAVNEKFRQSAADSYPNLDAYSFDYGPAHFVAINNNRGINNDAGDFRKWLLDDLKASTATWKFVCFHVPGFQSANQHYAEQQGRLLQPIFEEGGVDMTFAGHVHNYQRSVPLTFAPDGGNTKKGLVNGKFTLDRNFDGQENTKPEGVIHIVAGGGGASLYGPGLELTAARLQKEYGANYANYTDKMVTEQHTFVVLDIAPTRLEMRAFGAAGAELDRIVVTKK